MSYVCLWSPSWPTGADFPADLVASLLGEAPRVAVGERGLVWGDARGLHGGQLAEAMLRVASDYGFDDTRAGVAMTPVAAEVAAVRSETQLVFVKPGQDRAFIAPHKLVCRRPSISRRDSGTQYRDVGARQLTPGQKPSRSKACGSGSARAENERWLFIPYDLQSASVEWVGMGQESSNCCSSSTRCRHGAV